MSNEKQLSRQMIYKGRIMTVNKDEVSLPNGNRSQREIVRLSDAVAIVAITDDGRIIMVEQFRYPTGKKLLEIPAGKIKEGENPLECAKRELREETGFKAENWKKITGFYTSPGFCTEMIYMFLADGLSEGLANFDNDEFIEIKALPLFNAVKMVEKGEINDAKTIIGIMTAYAHYKNVRV